MTTIYMKTLFVTRYNKRTNTRTCCGILEYILDDGILEESPEPSNEEVCSPLCIDKDADYEKEEDLKELIQRAEDSGTSMPFHSCST